MNTLRPFLTRISRGVNSVLHTTRCQGFSSITQCQTYPTARQLQNITPLNQWYRSLTSMTMRHPTVEQQAPTVNSNIVGSGGLLSKINSIFHQPVRFYKVKRVLRLRCKGCYFERRFGRLYVECSLKGRHKQMKMVNKKYLYKDDYSEGDWKRAAHWDYRKDRFYRQGNNQYSRYNWLEGRLGTEI